MMMYVYSCFDVRQSSITQRSSLEMLVSFQHWVTPWERRGMLWQGNTVRQSCTTYRYMKSYVKICMMMELLSCS